jgi:UPF0755 protein
MQSKWVRKGKVLGPFGWFALTSIFLFLILVSGVSYASFWYQTSLKPVGGSVEKVFVVKKGETSKNITLGLESEGLIKSAFAVRVYLYLTEIESSIEAGSFKISSNQSSQEIIEELQKGQLDKWVTLVEGLRVEEIAEELSVEFEIDKEKFIDQAQEGYMFPDTYLIPVEAKEEKIVSILRSNFDKKVDREIKSKAKKQGLTTNELIILASIVERESNNTEERSIIAGVLLKRFREGTLIAADATIQYALGFQKEEKTWWKKVLTAQDLELEGPYNGRKVVGLPPTPISNPGLSSIKAVVDPTKTAYYYYIHDSDGNPHFAETFSGHQDNIAKYLN